MPDSLETIDEQEEESEDESEDEERVEEAASVEKKEPPPTKWGPSPPEDCISAIDKRKMIGKVLERAIIAVMGFHCYTFGGKYYKQGKGGAIGLRLTGIVARIIMDRWARKLKVMIGIAMWAVYLLIKYVDDCNLFMEALAKGVRWEGGKMIWTAEQEELDEKEGLSDGRRTMAVLLDMANSIYPYVQFTGDLQENHGDNKCPMLDLSTWKEREVDLTSNKGYREVVKHEFYQKPCASQLVIMAESAMPERVKIVTLSQEGVRRQRNCAPSISPESRANILSDLMGKMRRSGYNEKTRRNVITSAITGYYRMRKVEKEGGRRVNRPLEEGLEKRERDKVVGKTAWFGRRKTNISINKIKVQMNRRFPNKKGKGGKKGTKDVKTEGIVFVPCTPRGALVKLLQESDDLFAKLHGLQRVRFIERGGLKLTDQLVRKNPWGSQDCGRGDCPVCVGGEEKQVGKCVEECTVYKITCLGCHLDGVDAHYLGETSRVLYQRSKDHLAALEGRRKDSVLWSHCVDYHGSTQQEFKVVIIRKLFTPLSRQV